MLTLTKQRCIQYKRFSVCVYRERMCNYRETVSVDKADWVYVVHEKNKYVCKNINIYQVCWMKLTALQASRFTSFS